MPIYLIEKFIIKSQLDGRRQVISSRHRLPENRRGRRGRREAKLSVPPSQFDSRREILFGKKLPDVLPDINMGHHHRGISVFGAGPSKAIDSNLEARGESRVGVDLYATEL